jgi:hypothetical protein
MRGRPANTFISLSPQSKKHLPKMEIFFNYFTVRTVGLSRAHDEHWNNGSDVDVELMLKNYSGGGHRPD